MSRLTFNMQKKWPLWVKWGIVFSCINFFPLAYLSFVGSALALGGVGSPILVVSVLMNVPAFAIAESLFGIDSSFYYLAFLILGTIQFFIIGSAIGLAHQKFGQSNKT